MHDPRSDPAHDPTPAATPDGSAAPSGHPATAATNPSARAVVARHALAAAVLLGILADPMLRNGPWGIGLLVWMGAFAVTVVTLVRRSERPRAGESALWLTVAVLFAAGLSWHDADLLQAFDVLAMLAALVLLAASMDAVALAGIARARLRDLIHAAFETGLDVAAGPVPLLMHDAELHAASRPSSAGTAGRVGRALLLAVPILLVFTLLLRNADPVFKSFFTFPNLRLGALFSHLAVAGFFAWVVAGWLRRSLLTSNGTEATPALPPSFSLGTLDVGLALGALSVLFAAFVLVQVDWLFGGEALVLRTTGLSYAAYARHGFFELTAVAALLLPLLLGARALIRDSERRTLALYRRLALSLVVLLGAIMVSAGARMRLYVRYYGLSTDRVYATAFMIWLAVVFVWLALTVLRSRPRTFALGLVASGFAVLFTVNVLNPDAMVARTNLARAETALLGAGGADPRYVASLGGDAVPLLVSALTTPAVASGLATPAERCAAAETLLTRWTGARRERMSSRWTQWNAARSRAVRAVDAHRAALQQIACPATAASAGAPLRPSTPPSSP